MSAWPSPTYAAHSHSDAIASLIDGGRPWRGVVHSVFRTTLNVSIDGALLAIAAPSVGGLPNGIVVDLGSDFRRIGIHAGMEIDHETQRLSIAGAAMAIELGEAAAWSPRLRVAAGDPGAPARRWHARSGAVRALAASAAARRPGHERGLEALLPAVRTDDSSGVAGRAAPLLARLDRAVRDDDRAAATAVARTMIGLGPGLTPSGDDALVGVEAACNAVGSPMAGFLADALDDVAERTTTIAATFLQHAGRGEFAERLHGVLEDLVGSDDSRVWPAIERAIAWGASSGTDCLVGILLGLDAAADAPVAA